MSLKTNNFKLFKYEDNDIADLRFINDSMDIIDKGINPFYVATLDSANTYKVTTGLNKTVLNDGYSIKVAIPSNSTGTVSITVDSVTVPVKKPNGNAVTNFKANGVYSLTYYNSVFILASGGVDDVNFSASDLLTGKSANNSNGEKVNGTMPNKGAVTASLNCGGSYTIPKGYHNGSGKVTANSLKSQTPGTATASDILKGKTAWVNGVKIIGTSALSLKLFTKTYDYTHFKSSGHTASGSNNWSITVKNILKTFSLGTVVCAGYTTNFTGSNGGAGFSGVNYTNFNKEFSACGIFESNHALPSYYFKDDYMSFLSGNTGTSANNPTIDTSSTITWEIYYY